MGIKKKYIGEIKGGKGGEKMPEREEKEQINFFPQSGLSPFQGYCFRNGARPEAHTQLHQVGCLLLVRREKSVKMKCPRPQKTYFSVFI